MAVLARWVSPWSRFTELQRETDQLMRDVLAGLGTFGGLRDPAPGTDEQASAWAPAIDVMTRDNDMVVRAELSGVDPAKDIDISVHDGLLTIRGQRRHEDRRENDQYVRLERHYGAFERTLPIAEGVNPDDIKAEYRDGVLQVVIPGALQVSTTRKVPVQIASGGARTIEAESGADEKGSENA
jgi:HSP20 family protein